MTAELLFHVMISKIGCGYTGLDNYYENYWIVHFPCVLCICVIFSHKRGT